MSKRILALIVVIIQLLSLKAFAYSDETFYAENLEYNKLLAHSLGVERSGEGAITRGEFICAVVKLMKLDSVVGVQKVYEDVDEGSELGHSVYAANKLGLISPAKAFSPQREISIPEMTKIIVVMLGYEAEAISKGGYPYGYMAIASELDLLDNIDISKEQINESEFYTLLANCALADARRIISLTQDGSGWTTYYANDKTFIELYHNCYEIEGIVSANEYSYLYNGEACTEKGYVIIGNSLYKCNEPLKLGYKVKAIVKENNTTPEITAYGYSDTKSLIVSAENDPVFSDDMIEYYEGSNLVKKKIYSDPAIIYNQKSYSRYTENDFSVRDGWLELIDADDDNVYETIHIYERDYICVYSVSKTGIYDVNNASAIPIDESESDIHIFDGGKAADVSTIEKNTFIEYFASKDNLVVKGNVLKDKIDGKIEGVEKSDNSTSVSITVEEDQYETTGYFNKYYNCRVGDSQSFVLNSDGKIVAYLLENNNYKYACMIKAGHIGSGLDTSLNIKLFTEDANIVVYKISDKVKINGKTYTSEDELKNFLDERADELIRYLVNAENEVTSIFYYDGTSITEGVYNSKSDEIGTIKRYRFEKDDTATSIYYKSSGYFVPYFAIDGNTKTFIVDPDVTDETQKYSIASGTGFIENDAQVASNTVVPYNVDESGMAEALIYKSAAKSISVDSSYGIVESVAMAIDPEEETSYKINLYNNDTYISLYLKSDSDIISGNLINSDGKLDLEAGDIIRYSFNSQNFIFGLKKDYDASDDKIIYTGSNHNAGVNIYSGYLYSRGNSSFILFSGDSSDDKKLVIKYASATCVYVTKNGEVLTRPIDEVFVPYLKSEADCSKIVVRSRYGGVNALIVYEK